MRVVGAALASLAGPDDALFCASPAGPSPRRPPGGQKDAYASCPVHIHALPCSAGAWPEHTSAGPQWGVANATACRCCAAPPQPSLPRSPPSPAAPLQPHCTALHWAAPRLTCRAAAGCARWPPQGRACASWRPCRCSSAGRRTAQTPSPCTACCRSGRPRCSGSAGAT